MQVVEPCCLVVQIPFVLLAGCVTLYKVPNHSVPQFVSLRMDLSKSHSLELSEDKCEDIHQVLGTGPGTQ